MAAPYIAFTLQALDDAPLMARAAGVPEDTAIAGLLRLWAYCWRSKTDRISATHVLGIFGPHAEVIPALIAFGFLEQDEASSYLVKGADKYLRISEGRSKGGKTASKNLRQGAPSSPAEPRLDSGLTPAEPRLSPGLSLSTEHRTLNTEHFKDPSENDWQTLVEQLFEKFREIRGKEPEFSDADWGQLKQLRKKHSDEDILLRWARGLRGTYDRKVNALADLAKSAKWNALATAAPGETPADAPETARHAAIDWVAERFGAYLAETLQKGARRVEWDSGPPVRVETEDTFWAGWVAETFGGQVVAEVVT